MPPKAAGVNVTVVRDRKIQTVLRTIRLQDTLPCPIGKNKMDYLPPLHVLKEFQQHPLIHTQLHHEEEHPKYAKYKTCRNGCVVI